ncbi:NADPH:quinone reductase-like Zn-dependent oxidoreductase [Nocardiopsis arvandica]|uniref:NADPH:quinone reductase-like Zn-dependent oxidoreductase n=1 Tax=Nocardiopsis sinuspersici TaxID=501010 RepID=A0A7Z0BNL6_9ACTN|nr:NAD(P)-dependent alcohol dehydrogenase [Nocardiopsis sinuspersici]NYH55712.1 NADPH:quinone reductase-like Zn-dependent oxidoreductase [Nocardiopsis sinuspersici]
MRAALYDRYGGPEVLYEGTVARPDTGPGDVLVRVHAASVNGGELLGRAGGIRLATWLLDRGFPKRTGNDFAGEVVEAGSGVSGFAPGDRVWGGLPRTFGSAAEFVAVAPRQLALAPAGLNLVEAAALPVVGTTAVTALRDRARLAPGERLLVRGASGGVGSVAVQLGRAYGAHVTALAGAEHLGFVRELGADEAFDYAGTGAADLPPFDVVLDTVGTGLRAYRRRLTGNGRIVAITFDSGRMLASLSYIAASAVFGSRRVRFFSGDPGHELFAELTRLTESGAVRPVVDRILPLAEIAEAHRALEAGGIRGKVVVSVAGPDA